MVHISKKMQQANRNLNRVQRELCTGASKKAGDGVTSVVGPLTPAYKGVKGRLRAGVH